MNLEFELLPHQEEFVFNLEHRFVAFVGGYGTGKTEALCYKAIYMSIINKGKEGALMSPTVGMATRTVVPKLKELLEKMGIKYTFRKSSSEFDIFIGQYRSHIYVLSAENYERLRGLNLAWVGVDEVDTIKPTSLAFSAWEQIQARLRDADDDGFEQAFCVSTPEGFGFLYEWFEGEKVEALADGKSIDSPLMSDRKMYQASTYSNYTLKPSYIESLKESYPAALINAYLNGRFVNLKGNPVYVSFDRVENGTTTALSNFSGAYPLHIGMDFNVNDMSAVVCVVNESGNPVVVDEIYGLKNTRAMIEEIRRRYGMRSIYIYPDASAVKGSSNSDTTDMYMLKSAGFTKVIHQGNNPRVQDRVNNVNRMLCDGNGNRRLLINTKTCPVTTSALLQQIYDPTTGQPDKHRHEQDGPMDALGYFIYQAYPMLHGASVTIK